MLNRRGFLALLASATVQPGFSLAAGQEKKPDPLQTFYLQVTRTAYDAVFKAPLGDDKIQSSDDLEKALEDNWGAYKAAFISNATALIAQGDAQELKKLTDTYKNGRGLSIPLRQDSSLYTRNGRFFSKEQGIQPRSGEEETNPLFLRIHDLALAGKISRDVSREVIETIGQATFSEAVHGALKSAVLAAQKTAKPDADATFKIELK